MTTETSPAQRLLNNLEASETFKKWKTEHQESIASHFFNAN